MSSPYVERRRSSSSNPREKFPDLDELLSEDQFFDYEESETGRNAGARTISPARTNGVPHSERWQTGKDNHLAWGDGHLNVVGPRQHRPQKSISDAFKNIRTRKASVSENAHEIAEALRAPISLKILVGVAVASKHTQAHMSFSCSALFGI